MASAAGVAGVRATLDLGSKNFKCVQCREPDSARITRDSEVIHLDEKRPTLSCDLRRVVCSQSAVWRQHVQVTSRNKSSGQSSGRRTSRSAIAQDYLRHLDFTSTTLVGGNQRRVG